MSPTTSPSPAASAAARPAQVGRIGALDGLRGLALIGMLAWHAELGWVKGGFARMTIFFVLSGFLAAKSWIRLQDKAAPRRYSTYWRRRVRRLVPITMLGVVVATITTVLIGSRDAVADLWGDAASVIFGVSNWRFVAVDRSYGELFERPSAFQHFWSLSLEEQLFWILPMLVALAVTAAGRRHAWIATGIAAVACAAIPAWWEHTPDAAYYGTHVRAGEFLTGVTLALLLARTDGEVPERWKPTVQVLGALSLVGLLTVMFTVDRELDWLYRGGLGIFALPAVAVVAAVVAGPGVTGWFLSFTPFQVLGRAALSIYALHWPFFQLLGTEHTGLTGTALVAVQLAVGIGVGLLAFHFIEKPLMDAGASRPSTTDGSDAPRRTPRILDAWARDGVALGAMAVTAVLILGVAALPTPEPPLTGYSLRELEHQLSGGVTIDLATADQILAVTPAVATPPAAALQEQEVRVGLFGGSTAVTLGAQGHEWSERSDLFHLAPGYARLGCGLFTEGVRVTGHDPAGVTVLEPADDYCLGWERRWPAVAAKQDLDLAIIMVGVWDTASWQVEGRDELVGIEDPEIAADLEARLRFAVALFHQQGVSVAVATTPEVGFGVDGDIRERRVLGPHHVQRVEIFNDMVRRVVDDTPDTAIIEYGPVIDLLDPETSAAWLPDGIHPTEVAAAAVWDELLGPTLEAIITSGRSLTLPPPPGSSDTTVPTATS